MEFNLPEILNVAGPTATLVFASWIFLGYLNQRVAEAYQHYRELLGEYRCHENRDTRHQSIRDQIVQCKRRCGLSYKATNLSLIAALFLYATLLTALVSMAFKQVYILSICSVCCSLIGIMLLAAAAILTISENFIFKNTVDTELMDIPELSQENGRSQAEATKPD